MSEPPPKKLPLDAIIEEQIQAAYAAGEFDNLPGYGKPIPGIDEPYDEQWWIKQKLKREEIVVLPPSLEILRDVEQSLARLKNLRNEPAVRRELLALNERIRDAHYRSVWGPPSTQMPLDIEAEVARWRAHRQM